MVTPRSSGAWFTRVILPERRETGCPLKQIRAQGDHMTERVQRIMIPARATTPEIGKWLWALEDARARTKRMVDGITQPELDTLPDGLDNTIGTLLYHIALIEADYLCIDVMGWDDYLPDLKAVLPLPDRSEDGMLSVVTGVPID